MTAFPTNVKYLDAATFTETLENTSIAPAKMEGGYVISRPRHTRRPRRTWSFGFTMMKDADVAILQTFWDTVKGGSNSFTWVHPVSHSTITVRFSPEMTMKFNRIGAGPVNYWQTDAIILIEV